MSYDFDREIDRVHTNDLKWRVGPIKGYLGIDVSEDVIPMWIADMDLACAPVVVDAVRQRAEKEIYGYCAPGETYYKAVRGWFLTRDNWTIEEDWITVVPSIVAGINIAIRAFTNPGDKVIIQQPVYDPFEEQIKLTGRVMANNQLVLRNHRYEMNLEELETLASDPDTKLMVLCSPHNPVGRVWTEKELQAVGEICLRHDVIVVSDEIHSDIVYSKSRHLPFLTVNPSFAKNAIVCTAPGKTFNISGLKMSNLLIPDPGLREQFVKQQKSMALTINNTFGVETMDAAYSPKGREWLEELLVYLEGNADMVEQYVDQHLPKVSMIRPEGTFVCWLDCSKAGMEDDVLIRRLAEEAKVVCVPGGWFGEAGNRHLRVNIGCTRKTLREALERMGKVLN